MTKKLELNKLILPNEEQIQISFIENLKIKYPNLFKFTFHIPNGADRTKRKNKNGKWYCPSGVKLKRMGVKAGVADILFMFRKEGFGGLWLEFKSSKGVQSESQKDFEKLCHIAGYDYHIVRSVNEALIAFKRYMNLK